ncbi:MAG: hypothetical protein IKL65_04015 [Bacilli bacterium]|nr:hypothetical protein [Bacilli bacterium]
MFGEKPMFGQNEIKVDEKGRIFIPAYTKREPGEELVLMYNENLKLHEIYSVQKLDDRFKKLSDLIDKSITKKEKNFYEKMLLELSKSILRSETIDCQGRFLTGKVFEGQEKVLCTGAHDHLIIEPVKSKK